MFRKPDSYKNVNTSQTKKIKEYTYIQKFINFFKYYLND